MRDVPLQIGFLPAYRASAAEIERQSAELIDDPLMRTVVDSSKAYITVLNSNRQIVFANRAVTEAFGSNFQEALGARPGELIGCSTAATTEGGCGTSPSCATCGAAIAIRSAQRGETSEEECRITQINGNPVDLQVTATPLEVNGETFVMFTAIDIGDTKRRRALERIFFHDIMNTATGVRGLSSLVREVDEDERDKLLELLESASDQLIDEIQAQRQLLAAETEELVPRPAPVDSGALLTEIADIYGSHEVAAEKNIMIDPFLDEVEFQSDATLLARVIANLVKNALEATSVGGSVVLSCRRYGSRVSFSVHNDSYIPREAQPQVFKRSFTTKGEGRGLGTYGARLLTERYLGGDISFESRPEVGTTFTASYPLTLPTAE